MSNSSLSSLPVSEPSLPILPPTPFILSLGLQSRRQKKLVLLDVDSVLYTENLFSRTLLETSPPNIQLRCTQPECSYAPKPHLLSYKQTSNLWTHYNNSHAEISTKIIPKNKANSASQSSSHASDFSTLFTPRIAGPKASSREEFQTKYRALLLDFVVSNNLALQVVDSSFYRRLIDHCCHGTKAKYVVKSLFVLQEELTKERSRIGVLVLMENKQCRGR